MARDYHLICADSHILEPPHLWKQYMPRKFHDKAPKVVPDGEGGEAWQFSPELTPAPSGNYATAGRKHEDERSTGDTYAEANEGLTGRVVNDIAAERGQEPFECIVEICANDRLRTVLWPMPSDNDPAT